MSKFVSDELFTIDCGDGEWLKIPARFSVEQMEKFNATNDMGNVEVVAYFAKEWNFKDVNGEIPALTAENLRRLDIETFTKIMDGIKTRMTLSKKKLPKSEESLEDTVSPK